MIFSRPAAVMRSVLSYLGYPLVLVLAMGSFFALVPALGVEWAQTPSTVVGIALMALIERLNPHEPAWNQGRGDTRADAILNLVGGLAPPLLFNALFVAGLVRLGEAVQARIGHGLWPLHWSLGAQIVLAVLVAEFFVYWMHRALHQVASLWRFHAVHHAAERLYWLNANRVHPVESLVAYCPAFGALVFLGAPSMVLGAWGALAGIHGITQHMNASVRLGPLNFILSTPALHRWHHSRNRKYADGNYGAVTIFWDLIFGTRVFPPQPHEPSDLGVDHAPSYVLGSSWQLLSAPFTTRWETGGSPAPSEGGLPAPVSHSSHTGTPS